MAPVCEAASAPATPSGWFSTRAQIVAVGCACAGASAFLYAVNPTQHAIYPQCILYRTTGIYCAGCGATRALYALLHGRVLDALHDNALFIGALPFLAGLAGWYLLEAWQKKVWPDWSVQPRLLMRSGIWIFLTMLLFMVMRNFPGWPFELLKPLAG